MANRPGNGRPLARRIEHWESLRASHMSSVFPSAIRKRQAMPEAPAEGEIIYRMLTFALRELGDGTALEAPLHDRDERRRDERIRHHLVAERVKTDREQHGEREEARPQCHAVTGDTALLRERRPELYQPFPRHRAHEAA